MEDRYEAIKRKVDAFDLDSTAAERVLFFECYINNLIPDRRLVFLGSRSSVLAVLKMNRGTGTPSPWKLWSQVAFSGNAENLSRLVSELNIFDSSFVMEEPTLLGQYEIDKILGVLFECDYPGVYTHYFNDMYGFDYDEIEALESDDLLGFVYVVFNEVQPTICKVGYTDRDPRLRAAELSIELGLKSPYKIALAIICHNAERLEQDLHFMLASIRVSKEYFERRFCLLAECVARTVMDNQLGGMLPDECQSLVRYENEKLLFPERSISREIAHRCHSDIFET